ncbi:metallophosphoesterase [Mycetohabitans endofungorum]|uniref:metallophosphoesterase n=1 Tax=Mycetohabitans endofungorum TaxID=417203 RepID=UPI002B056878|nr:metallophosphoesterase [Mycetohabitans endofungorum]
MNDAAYRFVACHPWNDTGRDFVVGDLHGCTDALRYLLAQVRFHAAHDRLFSVGDLVDRGDHPVEALALLEMPWFFAVKGNHEEVMCDVSDGVLPQTAWDSIGGAWARALPAGMLSPYAARVRRLPLARVVGTGARRFNVLHAEFFGDDLTLDAAQFDERTRAHLLWGRQLIAGEGDPRVQRGLSHTYCGHTPVPKVRTVGAQTFVDTGAFLPHGALSIVDVHSGRIHAISTREALRRGAASLDWPTHG